MAIQYRIKEGDTLANIAKQYGTTVDVLAQSNNIADPNKIIAGESLSITNAPTEPVKPEEATPVSTPVPPAGASTPPAPNSTPVPTGNATPVPPTAPQNTPQVGQVPTPAQNVPQGQTGAYAGSSIVDYLRSIGQPYDFNSRRELATQSGMQSYRGTSAQNLELLQKIKSQPTGLGTTPPVAPAPTPTAPTVEKPEEAIKTTGNPITDTLLNKYGITPSYVKTNETKSPFSAFADNYKDLYESMGLNNIKADYDSITKQYSDLQEKKTLETDEVNDNPWLSEAVRQAKIKRIEGTYEGRESALTNKLKLYESLYDKGRQEAQFVAGKAMEISHQQQVLDQQMILKAIELAEKESEALLKAGEVKHSPAYVEWQDAVESGYKGNFMDYQNEDANRKLSIARAGANGFTPYQENSILSKLNENVSKNATYAKTVSMRTFGDNVKIALSQQNGTADIAAINQFQKVIDEGAVTRDQDVILIRSAQSFADTLKTKIKSLEEGDVLLQPQRDKMEKLIDAMYKAQVTALNKDPYIEAKRLEAKKAGLAPEETILGQLSGFNSPQKSSAPAFIPDSEMKNYETADIQENPSGFFNSFLKVFGI